MNRNLTGKNTMKKFLLATVAVLAMATSASAADLAARPYTKAAPVMVAMYDWSGFYVGVNGGGGWTHKCWDIVPVGGGALLPEGCHDASGGTVGGQVGYRWQASSWVFGVEAQGKCWDIVPVGGGALLPEGCHDASGGTVGGQVGYRWQASSWVFGVEAQGNWADFTGSRVSQQFIRVAGDASSRTNLRAFGLFTGQVGYAWNNVLLYVKGGAAVTDDRYDHVVIATNTVFESASETRWGGVVGAGLEFGFAPNWSAAIEYDHMFMQDQTLNFRNPAGVLSTVDRIRQDVDVATVRVNYRFGGPVVAKY